MLEVSSLSVWLPGAGVTVREATLRFAAGSVTMFVGPSGSGLSSFLKALSGTLPPGARVKGKLPRQPDILFLSDAALPPSRVADFLFTLTDDARAVADRLDLTPYLSHRVEHVPLDIRSRLHLATLLHAPRHDWVVLDSVVSASGATLRRAVVEAVRSRAEDGAGVLWAEHDVNVAWQAADRIIELHEGEVRYDGEPTSWVPTSVPEPTLLTLARALELPITASRTSGALRQALRASGQQLPARRPRTRALGRSSAHTVAGEVMGADNPPLEIGRDECIGLVSLSARPEPIARRIIAALPNGAYIPSRLPANAVRWARSWERAHQLEPGTLLTGLTHRRQWGTGEWAGLRTTALVGPTAPVWIPHPQAGLDARDQHRLAEALRRGSIGPRIVTSRDLEFLVRACHRVVVFDGDRLVADGSVYAVADKLRERPLVAAATGSSRYLRLSDVFEALEAP